MIGHTFKQTCSMVLTSEHEFELQQTCIWNISACLPHICKIMSKHMLLILEIFSMASAHASNLGNFDVHIQGKSVAFKLNGCIQSFRNDYLHRTPLATEFRASIWNLNSQAWKSLSKVQASQLSRIRSHKPPMKFNPPNTQASEVQASKLSSILNQAYELSILQTSKQILKSNPPNSQAFESFKCEAEANIQACLWPTSKVAYEIAA